MTLELQDTVPSELQVPGPADANVEPPGAGEDNEQKDKRVVLCRAAMGGLGDHGPQRNNARQRKKGREKERCTFGACAVVCVLHFCVVISLLLIIRGVGPRFVAVPAPQCQAGGSKSVHPSVRQGAVKAYTPVSGRGQ